MSMGQPQGQWGPPPQRRNIWPIVLLLLVLLLGGGGAAWFVLQRGDSGAGSVALAEGEVFMEPAAAVGPDPFSAQPMAPPPDPLIAKPALQEPTRVEAPPQSAVQASSGAQPGLYGGTQNDRACDQQQMIAFLAANPDKANAWVTVQNADPTLRWAGPKTSEHGDRTGRYAAARLEGLAPLGSVLAPLAHLADRRLGVLQTRPLTVADLPAYVGALTPLVLLADTRVTNHSFVAGQAPPRQAVMQKGTAVLVDAYGVPRARCYCGNPLLPPVPSKVQVVYVGTSWPDFNPGAVGVVSAAPQPVTSFQVRMPDGTVTTITVGGPPAAASPVAAATNTVAAPAATGQSTATGQPTTAGTATAGIATATASTLATATAPAPATASAPATAVPATAVPATAVPPTDVPQVLVDFVSTCVDPVDVYWVDPSGTPQFRFTLQPGERLDGHTTWPGHVFRFENASATWDWTVPAGGGTHRICG